VSDGEKIHPSRPSPPTQQSAVEGAREDPTRFAEDLRLMQLVARGDGHAQRLLANRLVVRVRRAATAIMRGSVDADDASQHALIEILRSAHNYRGDSSVERWADRITSRSVIRFARAVRRRNQTVEPNADTELAPAEAPDERTAEGVVRGVDAYLALLPESRREVLILRHGLGHSVEEIAELTQTSPNTVKDRLLAARRDMRKLIQRDRAIGAHKGGKP